MIPIPKPYYQINQYIRHDKLRVIDETGTQIGILNTPDALKRAQSVGLDLIVITDKATPPIAKIIDFQKYKYQQDKKARSGAVKTKATEVKEVRITPFIATNDFNTRLSRAAEFLSAGHRVRIVVKFTGRQITRKEFGEGQLTKAIAKLDSVSTVEVAPKLQGKLLTVQLKPKQQTKNEKPES